MRDYIHCEKLNNRIVSFSILYSTTLLGLSKLILLIKPMIYHAADHDHIAKWLIGILVVYLVQDTIVYLAAGNVYYCHSETCLRVTALYNMTVDKDDLRAQKISKVHGISDALCILMMFSLEIIITQINFLKLGKYKKIYARLRKQLTTRRANVVEDIEMGNLRRNHRRMGDNPESSLPIVLEDNPGDNSRDSSNRNYLMIIVVLYMNIVLVRYQTAPGANYRDLALLCWRLYSRSPKYYPIVYLGNEI